MLSLNTGLKYKGIIFPYAIRGYYYDYEHFCNLDRCVVMRNFYQYVSSVLVKKV